MALSWNQLFANGSIVHLHTSVWRAKTRIRPADLGIDDTEAVRKALSLGSHRLAPKDAFADIDAAAGEAARIIDHFSLNFGLIRGARYVPDKNIEMLMERLISARARFQEAVDAFVRDYETIKADQLPKIRAALAEAAKTPEAAADAYERLLSEYPDADHVSDKFKLKWSIYTVQGTKTNSALAAISEETEEVKTVVSEMVGQLRAELTEKLAGLIKIVEKGGRLPERSLDSAMEMLDRLEGLNILDDTGLADIINRLRKAFNAIDPKNVNRGFVKDLEKYSKELIDSQEEAVQAAEQALTGIGRRKMK